MVGVWVCLYFRGLIHSLPRAGRFSFIFNHCYLFSVPSRAPSNIRFTNVKSTEVTVNWNPLSEQYANGRLLGYRVYFQETAYYSVSSNTSSVNVTTNSTRVTLTGLRPGQRYHTYISAFTSKGAGPRSSFYYITTGRSLKRQSGLISQQLEVIRD